MRMFDAAAVAQATPWTPLVDALSAAAAAGTTVGPERHVHAYSSLSGPDSSLLLMPAWTEPADGDGLLGVKTVTYVPDNLQRGLPTINAVYLVFDRVTGALRAILDGDALTGRRTAAISALAARHLARPDARHLLVVGTGHLAPSMIAAHLATSRLERVTVWGRDSGKAQRVAAAATSAADGVPVVAADDLAAAAAEADVIVCVTAAMEPLLFGRWLRPGTHVSLLGSFRADIRETDDDVVRAATLFVDVPGAVLAGDLSQPIASGVLTADPITADLAALTSGRHPGRTAGAEVTVFKSVGYAAADLAAARLALGG